MPDALKTREGFFGLLAAVMVVVHVLTPKEYHGIVDGVLTGAGSIAASRIYKKQVTPGLAPFKSAPMPESES